MNAARWDASNDPWDMLGWRLGDYSVRQQGLWAVACCRRIWDLLPTECREMVEAAEVSLERTDYLVGVVNTAVWGEHWRYTTEPAICAAWMLTCPSVYKSAVGEVADAIARRETGIVAPSPQTGWPQTYREVWRREQRVHATLLREVCGNPYRPVTLNPAWRTSDVLLIAQGIYESRDHFAMPILADALQDAGCDSPDLLGHCRDTSVLHVRGCWVVDLVLGKS